MARIWQSGFELNSITDGVEVDTGNSVTGGAVLSIDSSIKRSGNYSLKVTNSGAAGRGRQVYQFKAAGDNGPFYIRTYFRVDDYPDGQITILFADGSAAALRFSLRINTDGTLGLYDSTTQIGSNSGILSLNTWYRLEVYFKNNTVSGKLELTARIDGTDFATTTTSANVGDLLRIVIGTSAIPAAASSYTMYWDDVAINDSIGSFQNSYPGSGSIVHCLVNAAGDINGFLVQVGGTAGSSNNFTRVNEVPPNDATSYNASAVLNAEDLFAINTSAVPTTSVINVVLVGVRLADIVAADATSGIKVEMIKASGGTKAQSANIVPNSTTWRTNGIAIPFNYPLTLYQDPDNANWNPATWTPQIGYTLDAVAVRAVGISAVWASIDFTPTNIKTVNGLVKASIKTFNGLAIANVKTINGLT